MRDLLIFLASFSPAAMSRLNLLYEARHNITLTQKENENE